MKTTAVAAVLAALTAAPVALAQSDLPPEIRGIVAKANCRARTPITIGATRDWLARSCWGWPSRRNTSKDASGSTEQWVYEVGGGTRYVYIAGGVVARVDDYGVRM